MSALKLLALPDRKLLLEGSDQLTSDTGIHQFTQPSVGSFQRSE
jgi:hypothetical protein